MPPQKACGKCTRLFPCEASEWKWKSLCEDCYGATEKRKCKKCDSNLPLTVQRWVKVCTSCWKETREKTHTTCPLCPTEKSTHLRRKKGEPCCKDCAKAIAFEHAEELALQKVKEQEAEKERERKQLIERIKNDENAAIRREANEIALRDLAVLQAQVERSKTVPDLKKKLDELNVPDCAPLSPKRARAEPVNIPDKMKTLPLSVEEMRYRVLTGKLSGPLDQSTLEELANLKKKEN